MSEKNVKLMELINEGKTCNEICHILNISNKQLFNTLTDLKNNGLFYRRKYYSNGSIVYSPITSSDNLSNFSKKKNSIITTHKERELKVLVISDLHFGNKLERLDLVDRAYNYCIKHTIHIIFCCGDLIDGPFTHGEQTLNNLHSQIEHFIKDYPFDENILTFGVGGDHDIDAFRKKALNIIEMLRNYRHDIIIGSYGNAFINIKNDRIHLFHKIDGRKYNPMNSPISLHGHFHRYKVDTKNSDRLDIIIPSLSNVNQSSPSAIQMNFQFNQNGFINSVYLKQVCFGNDDYILTEEKYDITINKDIETTKILNEENEVFESYQQIDGQKVLKKN